MKGWVKGVLIGGLLGIIWALTPFILDFFQVYGIGISYPTITHWISFPAMLAVKLGFSFIFVVIGAPLVGFTIGAIVGGLVGLLISLFKK